MDYLERQTADWLTRQGCHWLYIDQRHNVFADGAKRADPMRPIHRPDLLALLDGFGTIAIDVKHYDFQHSKMSFEYENIDGDDDVFEESYPWVSMSWKAVEELFSFQNVSNIPTWICIADRNSSDLRHTSWFRADQVFMSYAKLFLPQMMASSMQSYLAEFPYFENWPEIRLQVEPTRPDQGPEFQLLVGDPEDVYGFLTEYAEDIYVPPRILDLVSGSSIKDLIGIRPATKATYRKATRSSYNFASAISVALKVSLPLHDDQRSISEFISRHKKAFDEGRSKR